MSGAKPIDRTYIAVKRQLDALNVSRYELGVYHRADDSMRNFELSAPEILKRVNWLKRENINGCDIYIRPQGSQGLVFFDDLSAKAIERLRQHGLSPAVVIESSPANFQGWIRVSSQPITAELATTVCKKIAAEFGGDSASADWRHYGRLAGFTNRKPEHVTEQGRYPFALLSSSSGKLAEASFELLSSVGKSNPKGGLEASRVIPESIHDKAKAKRYFSQRLRSLCADYGDQLNTSKADWMIIKEMVAAGFSRESVKAALLESSLAMEKRQGNHAAKYLDVTLSKAFDSGFIK